MKRMNGIILAALLASTAIAQAQPAPDPYPEPAPNPNGSPPQPGDGSAAPTPTPDDKVVFPDPTRAPPVDSEGETLPPPVAKVHVPRPPLYMPQVLTTPTGWLLPAAVLYSKTQLDTGGGVTSDQRVGLGDVAEFGVATTDAVRE
nr:hypothetical protein [Deltaproteobacteria bacterium]